MWDVFAVSTYGTISLLFWFVGLIPDLATLRDRSDNRWVRIIYGMLCDGLARIGAALAPLRNGLPAAGRTGHALVVSVHTVVSFDFAIGIVPGWHTTIFPPYFVAGAIYSGFAMVLTLAIPLRKIYGLEDFLTDASLDNIGQGHAGHRTNCGLRLPAWKPSWLGTAATAMTRSYCGTAMHGPYAFWYLSLLSCNIFIPQVLWIRKLRKPRGVVSHLRSSSSPACGWSVLSSSWSACTATSCFLMGHVLPHAWDFMTFIGTLGFFVACMFLFCRLLPMISIFEIRTLLPPGTRQSVGGGE